MWRPVALSAFLALLFMTSRSGNPPVETDGSDTRKSDFGAEAIDRNTTPGPVKFDLARSSIHPKPAATENAGAGPSHETRLKSQEDLQARAVQVADLSIDGAGMIPLPEPKTGESTAGVRLVVTEGEEKTALTTGEDAPSLMPPGPDFAAKVQKELARLGCYRGRVDNIWGPMSRNAVARFNRVAKSKIPLKQPTRALLSSARKAPDGYCAGGAVASETSGRVAALEPQAGAKAIRSRPAYLPPWMRGEPMPEPGENKVVDQPEPDATPDQETTRTAARQEPRATTARAARRDRRVRRSRERRRVRRRSGSLDSVLKDSGFHWPGQ